MASLSRSPRIAINFIITALECAAQQGVRPSIVASVSRLNQHSPTYHLITCIHLEQCSICTVPHGRKFRTAVADAT